MAYFNETKSATMNIFRKFFFSKNGVCKRRIKSCFLNKSVHYTLKTAWKSELSYKNRCFFSLVGNYLRPSNNYRWLFFNINAVVLILIIC